MRLPREVMSTGSGIGPSVVRQLVERFRGRAWVEDAPDGAARFVIEGPGMSIRAPRSDRLGVGGNVSLADARGNYVERGNTTDGPLLGLLRTPPDWNNANYRGPNGQITFREGKIVNCELNQNITATGQAYRARERAARRNDRRTARFTSATAPPLPPCRSTELP